MKFIELTQRLMIDPNKLSVDDLKKLHQWYKDNISNDVIIPGQDNDSIFFRNLKQVIEYFFENIQPYMNDNLNLANRRLNDYSPIDFAAENGLDSIISRMDINETQVNKKNKNSQTPLHLACGSGHVNTVLALLHKGANPNIKNKQEETTLFSTLSLPLRHSQAQKEAKQEIAKLLIKNSPELIESSNVNGETILHSISRNGFSELVGQVLEVAPKLCFVADNNSHYPIHVAVLNNQLSVVKLLLNELKVAELGDSHNKQAIHYAASYSKADILQECIKNTTDIDIRDGQSKTPLMLAVEKSNLDAIKTLVENGANPELTDSTGNNLLHIAVKTDDFDVLKWLVENISLDINQENDHGKTPCQLAEINGNNRKIISYLTQHARQENDDDSKKSLRY